MITVYKMNDIPSAIELIRINDIFFNQNTAAMLDERAAYIIKKIDQSELVGKYAIKSRFDGMMLNIDKLSSGCKTVLNIMYNPDKIFDICECGDNALDEIYALEQGRICCEYPLISFEMKSVNVVEKGALRTIDSYEALKEWWLDENKAGNSR